MKIGDLQKLFGVSHTTIGRWIERYGDFLSNEARGINTVQRIFNETDLIVLATVAKLSSEGHDTESIKEQLLSGYRVESPSEANFGVDTRMVPAAAVEQMIDSTGIRLKLEQVTAERDKLLEMLQQERENNTDKDRKIEELQQEIKELQRSLGRAEGKLEFLEEDRKRSRE